MARTNIPVQEMARLSVGGAFGDADVTYTAADAGTNHDFENTGRELLYIKNASGGAIAVQVAGVADKYGVDVDEAINVQAGDTAIGGPYNPDRFNSAVGLAHVNIATDTSLTFAVVRLTPAHKQVK